MGKRLNPNIGDMRRVVKRPKSNVCNGPDRRIVMRHIIEREWEGGRHMGGVSKRLGGR